MSHDPNRCPHCIRAGFTTPDSARVWTGNRYTDGTTVTP